MSKLTIGIDILDRLFPFFFIASESGQFVESGPSLKKLAGIEMKGLFFNDLFSIARPAGLNFSDLAVRQKVSKSEMIVLNMKSPKAEFMGQALHLPKENHWLFVTNLVVQDADELADLKLDFNDFAIQDPIFDYLMLLQTQRRAIHQADVSNSKLAEAHRIAVKASETKSQFLANMSHELRTPMNGLLGMASILLETNLDSDQKDYVQTLITSGEAMLALVNDILDLSKIEAGFIQLERDLVPLAPLLSEIQATVSPLVQRKGLDLKVIVTDDVPQSIATDRVRMRQVILNLVGNAIKFTSTGTVEVIVSMRDQNLLCLCVKDTGIGMNQETLSRIFSPFVQGDSSMTKKFEGTGLGLSICKKLVEAMDGKIQVQSQEGLGSEFTILLKL